MERSQELEQRAAFNRTADIEDYLLEDPVIHNQKFFVLSYLLPAANNELKSPIIKMRGAYNTQEECNKRIERLRSIDKYFNMYICEVGKFGNLLEEEEVKKMDNVDIEYREKLMNTMVKEYRQNKELADKEFEERKARMAEAARFEGSKEGQELLARTKENPIAVKTRVDTLTAHLEDLNTKVKEVQEILELSRGQLANDYTEEEIKEAEKKMAEEQISNFPIEVSQPVFTQEDPFLQKKAREI